MAAKTAYAKLESEFKQEKGNVQDLRKMLVDERSVMSTMDMEHQQQLVELEQSHQEKVPTAFSCGIWPHTCKIIILIFAFFFVQVLYLLKQIQNKHKCESAEKETQKDEERSNEQELLRRLKTQVPLIKLNCINSF